MKKDSEFDKIKEKQELLETWVESHKQASEILPIVQMQLDTANWELEALKARPEEAGKIEISGLMGTLTRECNYLNRALPAMPKYDANSLLNSTAISTAGSANVYDYVSRIGDLGTPDAIEYSQTFIRDYKELQESQNRLQSVRDLIEDLNNPQTLKRFERATNCYISAKAQIGQRTVAAFEMRTFLDGLKGDLFSLAKEWPTENMTWEEMAKRIAKDDSQSANCDEILRQKTTFSSLKERLSKIGKDREGSSETNIENVWVQLLDHTYTILTLVNLSK